MKYWAPGSNLAVDEAICPFQGRAREKVNIPSKPTPEGFKRWTLAEKGYFITWVWHKKNSGPLCRRYPPLNPTQGVVPHLIAQLPSREHFYHVWLDNLFNSETLCTYLYDRGIGCSGTARKNSGVHIDLITMKANPGKFKLPWGHLETRIHASGHVCSVGWVDHGLVLFLTNAADPREVVEALRRRPAPTSTNAAICRAPFGSEAVKMLEIPYMVEKYNHEMGGVDTGDQYHAQGAHPRSNKGWKALFWDSIEVALGNAYCLSVKSPLGLGEPPLPWRLYNDFKDAVAMAFMEGGGDWGRGEQHHRTARLQPGISEPHERIKMPQRRCKACSEVTKALKRGLQGARMPLGNLNPNQRPPEPRRAASGCKACGVNLCRYGKCWKAYHNRQTGPYMERRGVGGRPRQGGEEASLNVS